MVLIMDFFVNLHPIWQGLVATLFTYGITVLGASVVFLFKVVNQKFLDLMMGVSAGVMIAASYWSLLEPAVSLSDKLGQPVAFTAAVGFIMGGIFIIFSDMMLSRKIKGECNKAGWKNCVLLVMAVTMHNIPEGLAVGVAFGNAGNQMGNDGLIGAIMLAVGIGIQNFPEGTCVAIPLRKEGNSRTKSFLIGQFSGMVEPIAGLLGAAFALYAQNALPLALSFSAGAMISVVCSELIPESFRDNKNLATWGILTGFVVMMVLDVALG